MTVNLTLTMDEANNQIAQNEQMIEALKNEATGCGDFSRITEIVHVVEPLESTTNKLKTAVTMAGGVAVVTPKSE